MVTRRKENERINESNRRMVLNLMDIKPTYRVNEFKRHEMDTQEKLRLVSKYNRNQYKSSVITKFREKKYEQKTTLPNIHDKLNKI